MKSAIAAHLPDEHFVIRIDGRVKSHHRENNVPDMAKQNRAGGRRAARLYWHDGTMLRYRVSKLDCDVCPLREGLQLRDQFPQHDVKVQSMQAESQARTALH